MRLREIFLLTILSLVVAASCSDDNKAPVEPPVETPELSIGDLTVAEGNPAIFTISLDRPADRRVVFSYFTVDVSAQANLDYDGVSGVDTIPVDSSGLTILVPTIDDGDDEPDETFTLTLTSVSNADVADSVGIGTIIDNDISGVSFLNDVKPILMGSCGPGCHGFGSSLGGLSLGDLSYDSVIIAKGPNTFLWNNTTDSLVVQPGNSALSTLYTKATSSPPFGGWMPLGGVSPLDTVLSNRIKDWIDQGAQDN
ncbi:MAG: hypothetical protein GY867_05795 [bacterium]|nr:hypothetical protein [bacterium]